MKRYEHNPIIRPEDVKPSADGMEVIGVFNAGASLYNGEIILLLRVAEKPVSSSADRVAVPYFDEETETIRIKTILKSDPDYDFSDARVIKSRSGQKYLTSISHIRVARSTDGVHFRISDTPAIRAFDKYTAFGVEDPRVTRIGEDYYVNFSAASYFGIITRLFKTRDFEEFQDLGNIFHPDNKDVAIFPRKIGELYYALHRPSTSEYGKPDMWIASSPDLVRWGDHKVVAAVREGSWESARMGAGAPPILTEQGWLILYHGADEANRYCMGAMLLDAERPWQVLKRLEMPLLEPTEPYETTGFFGNVIFVCGAVEAKEELLIYYGAADDSVCLARSSVKELLARMGY